MQIRLVHDELQLHTDDEIPGLVVPRNLCRDYLKDTKMMISVTAIDKIARVCHEANRAYCQTLGDFSQLPWAEAPEWQRASARMGVDLHLMGDFGPEASHVSWMKQKLEEGWTHGPVKDVEKREHPCMVPFDELPLEQQVKDHLFRAVVHALRPAESSPDGLTAPRIAPTGIEANIDAEYFFTAADGVYGADPERRVPASSATHLLTFCVLVLKNGCTVTGESACASPENFNAEIGRKIARQNAVQKIWPLMGYELRSKLAGEAK